MKYIVGTALIIAGVIIIRWTFNQCKKIDYKFSVAYFMCASGYGAGIGCIALGANIIVTHL